MQVLLISQRKAFVGFNSSLLFLMGLTLSLWDSSRVLVRIWPGWRPSATEGRVASDPCASWDPWSSLLFHICPVVAECVSQTNKNPHFPCFSNLRTKHFRLYTVTGDGRLSYILPVWKTLTLCVPVGCKQTFLMTFINLPAVLQPCHRLLDVYSDSDMHRWWFAAWLGVR